MKIIKNSLLLIKFLTRVKAVNSENGSYHRYVNKIAQHEVSRSYQMNDGSIQKLHFLKIQWYMATNLYLGDLMAGLRSQKLAFDEKRTLIYLGALMAITDLMVDDYKLDTQRISILLKGNYQELGFLSAIEKVFVLYHEKLLSILDNKKAEFIRDVAMRKPQIDSQGQMKDHVSEAEVIDHTRNKGGTAVILTASLLCEITDVNEKIFFQLGAFIQYLNDSQDMYKDMKAGVKTFVSFCHHFDQVNAQLKSEFIKTAAILQHSDYTSESIYRLMFNLHALFVGVEYKNSVFEKITDNRIENLYDPGFSINQFNINLFTYSSIKYCIPKILKFRMPVI